MRISTGQKQDFFWVKAKMKEKVYDIFIIRSILQIVMNLSKEELEKLAQHYFHGLSINREHKRMINHYLNELEKKHEETYLHSNRVGILSVEIVRNSGRDSQIILCPALGHDFGKLEIALYLLNKKKFSDEDHERMKPHVLLGVEIMKKIDPFYAAIILWHHYHKPQDSYPTDEEIKEQLALLNLPESNKQLSKEYGLLLAMADVYDAMITRDNNLYGGKVPPDKTELLMLHAFKDRNMNHQQIIRTLYEKGIFGQEYDIFFRNLYYQHITCKDKNSPIISLHQTAGDKVLLQNQSQRRR